MGAGERHGLSNAQGAMVIDTDPALTEGAGVDVGFEFNDGKNLRAQVERMDPAALLALLEHPAQERTWPPRRRRGS